MTKIIVLIAFAAFMIFLFRVAHILIREYYPKKPRCFRCIHCIEQGRDCLDNYLVTCDLPSMRDTPRSNEIFWCSGFRRRHGRL